MKKLTPLFLLFALACLGVLSPPLPAAPAGENWVEARFEHVTWLIHFASKREDGTLVEARGTPASQSPDKESADFPSFTAGQCTVGKQELGFTGGFVITKGKYETSSAENATRAVMLPSGDFRVFGGPARTRIIPQ